MTVYAKNHQSLHKIYKFGSVSKLLAMTVDINYDRQTHGLDGNWNELGCGTWSTDSSQSGWKLE